MPSIEWTTSLIVICSIIAIAGVLVGSLIAMVIQGSKISRLNAQLEQQQLSLEQMQQQQQQLNAQVNEQRSDLHQQALLESKLREQLSHAAATEQRLNRELSDYKQTLASGRESLEQTQQQRNLAEKGAEALRTELRNNTEQLQEAKHQIHALTERYEQLQQTHHHLTNEYTELNTNLQRKEEHFKEQMQQLNETKHSLSKEFENLANKIFEEKGKTFTQTSQHSIDALLKPFREQIEGFQKRINDVHDASLQGNTTLNSEIKKVLDIGLQMSKEANNLTSALKGDSQQRGAWGEAQLRRTLEMSGLIEEAHYEVQTAFKDAEGRQKQTDYLIKLPDGKHIIIDSKVALNAYDRAIGAETPEAYTLAMAEHVKAVRKHIDDLASKDYTNLVGMRSPSFVLMFMPVEPAYIEALKSNKDLFEYGYKKSIVLVSHTTLIPILRTVSNLWMMERSNAEAREISERAGDIYNQVCTIAERLAKLGGSLGAVSNHYNSTVKALVGQQGLYGKVDRFSQLSAKVSKTLPQLEAVHHDFETERLSMIVEPIAELEDIKVENVEVESAEE